MAQYGQPMNQGAIPNGSYPNQPPYNANFDAQAPVHNGYQGYAQPPYYPNQGAPPTHTPYGYYAPNQQPSNNGYSNYPIAQASVRRRTKPKPAKNGTHTVSYRVSGNRVSGNTGDHNGVFNIGNRNIGRDDEDYE